MPDAELAEGLKSHDCRGGEEGRSDGKAVELPDEGEGHAGKRAEILESAGRV